MTRLFLRFYVGVLIVLFLAWVTQAYVSSRQYSGANLQVIENAFRGEVSEARRRLDPTPETEWSGVLAELSKEYRYPVEVIEPSALPSYCTARFADGDDIVFLAGEDSFIFTPLQGGRKVLRFGALPKFEGPKFSVWVTGLAMVLLVAAAAIAVLLRPVLRQLTRVERAASAIASGDFGARVALDTVPSVLTLARAFNNMAGKTELVLKTQRELLQAVSHELRTPLSRIGFAVELIREEPSQKRLDVLEKAAQDLDRLLGELLHYTRLDSNETRLEKTDIALLPFVKAIIQKHGVVFPHLDIEVGHDLSTGEPMVRADSRGLERVLVNLLENACRFARSRVVVEASADADSIVIDVDDDGPGIPIEQRTHVFSPFVGVHSSKSQSGLGLAIVQRIVVQHGGTVEVLDSPLGGCRIRSHWPQA